jgi:hypothetical protein
MRRPRSRPYLIRYERSPRPCLASTERAPATGSILKRALGCLGDGEAALGRARRTKRRRRRAAQLRLAVPVRHGPRPRLLRVLVADRVVLAVRCAQVAVRRPVTASVLELVIPLTTLHTVRTIRGEPCCAIPRQGETRKSPREPSGWRRVSESGVVLASATTYWTSFGALRGSAREGTPGLIGSPT